MYDVLRTVQENLSLTVQETGTTISTDPLPKVMGDSSQLTQLMQNLISNAIKYRAADPPRIHISGERAGAEWVFSVRDNGVGIAPQFWEKIFLPFKRLHGREQPGTGIGLAICQKIVQRHGGRIWVESEEGRGSTFYFTIPSQDSALTSE